MPGARPRSRSRSGPAARAGCPTACAVAGPGLGPWGCRGRGRARHCLVRAASAALPSQHEHHPRSRASGRSGRCHTARSGGGIGRWRCCRSMSPPPGANSAPVAPSPGGVPCRGPVRGRCGRGREAPIAVGPSRPSSTGTHGQPSWLHSGRPRRHLQQPRPPLLPPAGPCRAGGRPGCRAASPVPPRRRTDGGPCAAPPPPPPPPPPRHLGARRRLVLPCP